MFFLLFFFKSQFSTSELNLSVGNAYRLLNLDQLYHSLEQFSDCKLKWAGNIWEKETFQLCGLFFVGFFLWFCLVFFVLFFFLPPACPPGHFKCSTGLCIQQMQRCDGINNCFDESDELFCGLYSLTRDLDWKTQWMYSLVVEGSWNNIDFFFFGGGVGGVKFPASFICQGTDHQSVSWVLNSI